MSPICVTLNTHSIDLLNGGGGCDVDQKGSYAACHSRAEAHWTQEGVEGGGGGGQGP